MAYKTADARFADWCDGAFATDAQLICAMLATGSKYVNKQGVTATEAIVAKLQAGMSYTRDMFEQDMVDIVNDVLCNDDYVNTEYEES